MPLKSFSKARETVRILLLIAWVGAVGASAMHPDDEEKAGTLLQKLSMRILEENGLREEYQSFVDKISSWGHRQERPPCTLEKICSIFKEPFSLEVHSLEIRDGAEERVVKGGLNSLSGLFFYGAEILEIPVQPPEGLPSFAGDGSFEPHLVYIEKVFDAAALLRAEALSELEGACLGRAYEAVQTVTDKFTEHVFLEVNADEKKLQELNEGLKVLKKIDCSKMLEAAAVLAVLVQEDYLKQLRKDLATSKYREKIPEEAKEAGFAGDILAYRETKHGPLIVGGRGATEYKSRAAFILDLGGSDLYSYAACPLDMEKGLSIAIDLDGNDKYITEGSDALASSRLGVSLLFDMKGNDVYRGTRRSQGFGGGGVALLWDEKGNDQYTAQEYAQGGAFFGIGFLIDREGHDVYSSYLDSQGFGLTQGFGALVDVKGDDSYTAGGHYPSSYGTKGIFRGASQGHGTGLRNYQVSSAPWYGGGIGLLLDIAGDDNYDAGNFSQGCGYFYGCGILADRSGDDVIQGTRYTQGSGAHQAAGILIDDEGDDQYLSKIAANQAGTWDVVVGMLLDFKGNDIYRAQGLAQAGSAQTAFALLFDGQGNDRYESTGDASQGATGSSDYHNKQSFSFFLDFGGGKDTYSRPNRKNNTIFLEKWYGVFGDFRYKKIEHMLDSRSVKLKGERGAKEK